jgi:hypothetical protein
MDTAIKQDVTDPKTTSTDREEGREEYFDYVFPEDGPIGLEKM